MNIPYVMKKCTKCGEWKVASTVNFHRSNKGRYGLRAQCKECRNNQNKQWQQTNRDRKAEYYKQYYQDNKEKIVEQHKQYRETNKEKITEYHKQYYQDNREKQLERVKRYQQTPQGQAVRFNSNHRRHLKEEQQGSGITKDQWVEMMEFFDWKCAYSGERLTKDNRSVDHIVPLNSNGDNMIWNMVPMLRSLNSSKNTSNMEEWYEEQSFFSEARLQKIYEWQEYAYNKYGKDTEYFNTNDIQIKLI